MLPELTTDEFSAALDSVAAEAIAAAERDGPPIDALAIAAALELQVAWDDRQQGRGRIVQLRTAREPQGAILLKHDPRPERLQWAVAHEIGEVMAVQVFARLGVDPREAPHGARETVANQLAGRILLPRALFTRCGCECGWDLPALKRQFSTASHELIARRMLDCEPQVVITVFDRGQRTFRRSNLRGKLPPLLPLEKAAWHEAHESGEPASQSDRHASVRAWPIHEPNWKREILRTEWNNDDEAEFL